MKQRQQKPVWLSDSLCRAAVLSTPVGDFTVVAQRDKVLGTFFGAETTVKKIEKSEFGQYPHLHRSLDFINSYFFSAEHCSNFFVAEEINFDMQSFSVAVQKVYKTLMNVPFGSTISYGALAEKAGIPGGARFAGNVMARNRFPLLIPCHRVIQAGGGLGGFSSGPDVKARLLRHEGWCG